MAKRKQKQRTKRRITTGLAGAPLNLGFMQYKSYIRTDIDKKDIAGLIRNYIRAHYTKDKIKIMFAAPDWQFYLYTHVAATIGWKNAGLEFPVNWRSELVINNYISELMIEGNKTIAENTAASIETGPVSRSPMEILKVKTHDMLANIDDVIDDHVSNYEVNNALTAFDELNIYSKFNKEGTAYNTAKASFDHIEKLTEEIELLLSKGDEQLNEAYSFIKPKRQKVLLAFLVDIRDDIKRYMLNKKATRKTKAPTIMTADRQVSKIKYAKESVEYKIQSINPVSIIGASQLYTFNTKNRMLTEYLTSSPKGFEMKGTTLRNLNSSSRSIRLRKPEDILPDIQSKPVSRINAIWNGLTTKQSVPNGRINNDTILVRIFK
jgi:hypothetical protein